MSDLSEDKKYLLVIFKVTTEDDKIILTFDPIFQFIKKEMIISTNVCVSRIILRETL